MIRAHCTSADCNTLEDSSPRECSSARIFLPFETRADEASSATLLESISSPMHPNWACNSGTGARGFASPSAAGDHSTQASNTSEASFDPDRSTAAWARPRSSEGKAGSVELPPGRPMNFHAPGLRSFARTLLPSTMSLAPFLHRPSAGPPTAIGSSPTSGSSMSEGHVVLTCSTAPDEKARAASSDNMAPPKAAWRRVILLDGLETDGTAAEAHDASERSSSLRCIENPICDIG
mmetsp:Transcript_88119/g.139258  ORF Transcript_88119/g.139258 Transcript_88119/m.139258 type:complete len:235 (-) Transcript_88119:227-931(-)